VIPAACGGVRTLPQARKARKCGLDMGADKTKNKGAVKIFIDSNAFCAYNQNHL
jgi:hypothetical protein